ncbi:hypothetical protein [Microbispora amethystogenes]|uniref:Uncharacterized protein n=1 Tax=Microbispora amethystogenes TaxID=1427754 RepID=A0ABQ4FQ63_9ACTN|nr:hypothetical protein [Microbispora amethystogenes]GIH36964.1 hypothetical protein Mam01_71280 [Microbispora amethystogenes]
MTDPAAEGARAAAHRLAVQHGPSLTMDVEAALHARDTSRKPDQYIDLISLGSLIVSVAALAWTVYADLQKKTDTPSTDVVTRRVRTELRRTRTVTAQDDEIVTVAVEETITAIEALSEPPQRRNLQEPSGES